MGGAEQSVREVHFYPLLAKYRKRGYVSASLLPLLGMGVLLAVLLSGDATAIDLLLAAGFAILSVVGAVLAVRATKRTGLEISPRGVTWFAWPSFIVTSTWRHVARIGPVDYRGREGLWLSEPEYTWAWWVFRTRWFEDMGYLQRLPLWVFADDWRCSEIGKDIERYAPDLFHHASR